MDTADYVAVEPGSYRANDHFYPRVPNAQLHPLVRFFLKLDNQQIVSRYCHLHPEVRREAVERVLGTPTRLFRWSGADLFHVTDDRGHRRFVVIETNSSPSGQKSMPLLDPYAEQGGYRQLLERTVVPMLKRRALPRGDLAVLWDKNWTEVSGYAAVLADLTEERVHLVELADTDEGRDRVRVDDGVLTVHTPTGWVPLRAAFRYVTQRPWNRLPVLCRTPTLNPVLACLAGGRNKSLAAIAYDLYNAELRPHGLRLRVPETLPNVSLPEVPLHLDRMGGVAVVKEPYSNAGQGVEPLVRPKDVRAFMEREHRYDRFLVQGLIGNVGWSSLTRDGRLYHIGTVPDRQDSSYVADLRVMVGACPDGFYPIALYSRRAPAPLTDEAPTSSAEAWQMLGTNLSVKIAPGRFDTEPDRLMLMDVRDFNHLGLGLDDMIEAYVQTVLATRAIDNMAQRLVTQKGRFRYKLFQSLVDDPALLAELWSE